MRASSRRRCLVSAFLAEVIQQIHSLRASGVMSFHSARVAVSAASMPRKSAGTGCSAEAAIVRLAKAKPYGLS